MTGIEIEQLLAILSFVPRSFELVVLCADGQTAQLDIAHGQLIAANLGPESDPPEVLKRTAQREPVSFRLRPIPFDVSPDNTEVTTDSIHDLLARIRLLTDEPITESGWRDITSQINDYDADLKPTETIDRRSLPPQPMPEISTAVTATSLAPAIPVQALPLQPPVPAQEPETKTLLVQPPAEPVVQLPSKREQSTTLALPVQLEPLRASWSNALAPWEQDPRFLSTLILQAISLSAISLAIGFAVGSLSTCLLAIALLAAW